MPAPPTEVAQTHCANCGAELGGPWCHACGQKRLGPEDRRFGHLLAQFIEALTDLDSRFWRSLRTLMLAPGRLSAEYLAGRRQRYMAPVTLFILANVLYFLAPGITDFELPFRQQISGALTADLVAESRELDPTDRARMADWGGQFHSPLTERWVRERVAARDQRSREAGGGGYGLRDLERDYDQRRSEISRLLVILHVPALGLFLWLLHPGSGRYYAEHFVVALHLFAFVLFLIELVVLPASLVGKALGAEQMPGGFALAGLSLMGLYFMRALQVAYAQPLWKALPRGLLLLVMLGVFSVVVYRGLQFALVLALC